jgi:hypothetical protein
MVFVFGVDVPLVELIFVLTLVMILLFGMLVYLIVSQVRLTRVLRAIMKKEGLELDGLKVIRKENRDEIRMLRSVKNDLDKMAYAKSLSMRPSSAKIEKPLKKSKALKRKAKTKKAGAGEGVYLDLGKKEPKRGSGPSAKKLVVVEGSSKDKAKEKDEKVYEAY